MIRPPSDVLSLVIAALDGWESWPYFAPVEHVRDGFTDAPEVEVKWTAGGGRLYTEVCAHLYIRRLPTPGAGVVPIGSYAAARGRWATRIRHLPAV